MDVLKMNKHNKSSVIVDVLANGVRGVTSSQTISEILERSKENLGAIGKRAIGLAKSTAKVVEEEYINNLASGSETNLSNIGQMVAQCYALGEDLLRTGLDIDQSEAKNYESACREKTSLSSGKVFGTIRRFSGKALIEGKKVILKNLDDNSSISTITNNLGVYKFNFVEKGIYAIKIEELANEEQMSPIISGESFEFNLVNKDI